jgi:hypothetical protein
VLEESPTNRYVILPLRPPSGDGELSDEDLEAAAGGSYTDNPLYCHDPWSD